jgi:hypothetical protein
MTTALVNLTLGGNDPGGAGNILHSRFRYFDPVCRRAGIPLDVAALVTGMGDDWADLILVNLNQVESRELIVQTGAYGEHRCTSIELEGNELSVGGKSFGVILAPGSGGKLRINMQRYVNQPTLELPF